MNNETIKQLIVIGTFFHLFAVIFASFTMIGSPRNISEYLEKTVYPERGYVVYVGEDRGGGIYTLYNKDGLFQTTIGGGYASVIATENYFGSKFICYYDITDPSNHYICYDSIIYDSNPVYKTKGYIVKVAKPEEYYESIELTICWKSNEGKWRLIQQSLAACKYEKYKTIKKKWEPIEISVFKTRGGFLAQVID